MAKLGIKVLAASTAVICALALLAGLISKQVLAAFAGVQEGPDLDGLDSFLALYEWSAQRSIETPKRAPKDNAHLPPTRIELYYVPLTEGAPVLKVSGMEVQWVEKYDMEFLPKSPYAGYLVDIGGQQSESEPPLVRLGENSIDLVRFAGTEVLYKNLGSRGRLFDSRNVLPAPTGDLPTVSLARSFFPVGTENITSVSVTERPVFEKDIFDHGVWRGTYAIFRSKENAKSASVVKS